MEPLLDKAITAMSKAGARLAEFIKTHPAVASELETILEELDDANIQLQDSVESN